MANVTTLEGKGVYRSLNGNVLVLLGKRSFLKRQVSHAGHGIAKAGRATGHAVAQAGRVSKRVVKRLIRGVANKILLHGDPLLGAKAPAITKNAAKALILPTATTAVLASTVTAPFSPLVPVILNEVLDEIYSSISKRVKKGLTPEKAASEVAAALEKDDDKALGAGVSAPVLIGAGVVGVAILLSLKKRR